MNLGLRYAGQADYSRIAGFLERCWTKDHVYVRSPRLFEWTFRRPDLWERDSYSFAVAETGGDIAGILGAIPFHMNVHGRTGKALWLANFMVQENHRRGGAALQLLRMFDRTPYQAIIAFRISETAAPLYRALKWHVIDDIPRHVAVMPGARERMIRFLQISRPDFSGVRAVELARFFEIAEPSPITYSTLLPAHWDQRDWPELAATRIGAVRDSNYLRWRYQEHPEFRYARVAVPDGRRTGLAVWRLETIRHQGPKGLEEIDRFARLVEFLPASPSNAEALLRALLCDVASQGAMAMDYFGYHGETRQQLEQHLMKCTDQHPDGRAIPSRFQPLDEKRGPIASAMRLRSGFPDSAAEQLSAWYWTKSDGDQDRPN